MTKLPTSSASCIRCVLRFEDDPDLSLDENGYCRWCREWDSRANERRVTQLDRPWLIYQIKRDGQGREYDAVIGLSGGVDSSLALHYAVVDQGLRVFAYNVDNGYNTPEADENIMRIVEELDVPFHSSVLDRKKFDELYRAYIKSGLKNLEVTTDHFINAVGYEMARKHNVKCILSGANLATESVLPPHYGYQARDVTQIRSIHRLGTGKPLVGLPTLSLGQYLWYRNIKHIKVVPLLDCYDYNRTEAILLLMHTYGYKEYGQKHGENRLTKWFQEVYLPQKFGLDKRRPHLSSLILSEQMTKHEAEKTLQKPLDNTPCPIPDAPDWPSIPPHDWSDYPNEAAAWDRWGRFFKVAKKLGWKA